MSKKLCLFVLLCAIVAPACDGGDATESDDMSSQMDSVADTAVDTPADSPEDLAEDLADDAPEDVPEDTPGDQAEDMTPDGTWLTLLDGDWTLPNQTEGYKCVYVTLEEDVFITAFEPLIPPGTHHTVLTVGPASHPDGIFDCGVLTVYDEQIYASGVGSNTLTFPEGVAVRLEAGQQLLLNLHLFNFTGSTLTGTSGTRGLAVPEEEVVHEAELVLMGTLNLEIPPGESTHTGRCTQTQDVTLFAVQPHMHQYGSHMRVVAESSSQGDVVIHDEAYWFDNQVSHLIEPAPVEMAAGDTVRVDCTYNNSTFNTIYFGDSSFAEMCFAMVYRYPAVGSSGLYCDQ